MIFLQTTILFDSSVINEELTKEILKEVYTDLEEHGYNAIKQITGYLISGDPGYISSYKECRSKIQKIDRNCLIELMLNNFLKWDILE